MKSFLSLVAESLLNRFGNDMHRVTIVFPNKRAGLFLTEELRLQSHGKPLWAPRFMTMSELFLSLSSRVQADSVDCIARLYHHYICRVGSGIEQEEGPEALDRETIDRFWGWGEILLSDFNDIDKHMADVQAVFAHSRDLDELNDLSYLTEQQREALRRFFGYFSSGEDSRVRRRFMLLWKEMGHIYSDLRADLLSDNMLWEGALQREVCELLATDAQIAESLGYVCFVGFNLLNTVEERLMKLLSDRALYYWDYDTFYVSNPSHEAGQFMSRNLSLFPSELSVDHFDNLSRLKEVTLISTSTDDATARYAHSWLQDERDPKASRNAIVLCNEQLLLPLLHSLPSKDGSATANEVNITMGFPLTQTPVFSFVNALLLLYHEGWDASRGQFRRFYLQPVLRHPYAEYLSEETLTSHSVDGQASLLAFIIGLLEQVGLSISSQTNPDDPLDMLYTESIYQAHRLLVQFHRLLVHPDRPLVLQPSTLRRLLLTALRSASIPFHGEPATGIQVMGVLETRCLDFSHLLMLSVEEDQMPRPTHLDTLLPLVVRESHGLTTPRHKGSLYAYHFYRLIQRCEHLTLVYNTNTTGGHRHEPSRFLLQLLADFPSSQLRANKFVLRSTPLLTSPQAIRIEKTPQMVNALLTRYSPEHSLSARPLSPTALNVYLTCPLQFYFQYIRHLRQEDEETDEIDAMQLGNIFHDSSEIFYTYLVSRFSSSIIERRLINPFLEKEADLLRPFIDLAFDMNIFHPITVEAEKKRAIQSAISQDRWQHPTYRGQQLIVRDVVFYYLRQLLRMDINLSPFTLVNTEVDVSYPLSVKADSTPCTLLLGGRIDRLDRLEDQTLRVVDYKTGRPHFSTPTLQAAFARDETHQSHTLQTLLYADALLESKPETARQPLQTALLYIRKAHEDDYDPVLKLAAEQGGETNTDFRPLSPLFREQLAALVTEILSTSVPFTQTVNRQNCARCPFAWLCDRPEGR